MPWWSGTFKSEVRIGSNTETLKVLTWEICSHGGRSDPPQKLIFYRLWNIFNEVSLKINYNKGIFYSFPRKHFFISFVRHLLICTHYFSLFKYINLLFNVWNRILNFNAGFFLSNLIKKKRIVMNTSRKAKDKMGEVIHFCHLKRLNLDPKIQICWLKISNSYFQFRFMKRNPCENWKYSQTLQL